ncbi:hypothetical protein A3G63_01160 [Candidatus Kaiserbacteria bacterium RIFCSPLOWO2_12_FULL_52_8]|uniref:Transglutaminase-like domain-containing protein n=1 Tax=Candidatus Kaiserbacteria bacterium RIFCSPHIGHO2_01_FULL_53_31 TaxID=1798481 RepID=A0A1F6CJ30_9BACT|nr:MAG: hypothetical protein A2678_01000 [Candidatus Kaiserbacteria bacterium RIFCSPHIGHO2_01_FULL_53_31]OGG94674.1 MAG: hypothetical protein A3G63_01160 [Candidatus Kaiserbacteria bacterium RIFCSPLOWO2_12_FULL_52_8]
MQRLTRAESDFTATEYEMLRKLSTPTKIQDFLDSLPMNWEKNGDTHLSPRRVIEKKKAHCIEGALLAATALWIQGEPPRIMNLSARLQRGDVDHVVALYMRSGYYGAISKTNHATIRFRDPIYRTLRELALSYFHEWFLNATGEKTLECYSKPLDMRSFGTNWITSEKDLWEVANALSVLPHYNLVPKGNWRYVRTADQMEIKAGSLIEWPESDPRT